MFRRGEASDGDSLESGVPQSEKEGDGGGVPVADPLPAILFDSFYRLPVHGYCHAIE